MDLKQELDASRMQLPAKVLDRGDKLLEKATIRDINIQQMFFSPRPKGALFRPLPTLVWRTKDWKLYNATNSCDMVKFEIDRFLHDSKILLPVHFVFHVKAVVTITDW